MIKNNESKKNFCYFVWSAIVSIGCAIGTTGFFLFLFGKRSGAGALTEEQLSKIESEYTFYIFHFKPEPHETLGYIIFLLSFCFFALLTLALYTHIIKTNIGTRIIDMGILIGIPVVVIFVVILISRLQYSDYFYLAFTSAIVQPELTLFVLALVVLIVSLLCMQRSKK